MKILRFSTDGLVIKETSIKDSDRLITVMTANSGIITAYASGVKSIKSRRSGATGLLAYSNFTFEKKGNNFRVAEASVNRLFFGAGSDIITLTLAQYFCELSAELCPADNQNSEFLRLILNSLHFLTGNAKNPLLIKAITELKIAQFSGYMPNIIACDTCAKFEDDLMYFKFDDGTLYCKNHKKSEYTLPITLGILKAMRHILYSPFEKIYSFELSQKEIKIFSDITEKYITYQTERNYKTLDFLKTLY